MAGTRTLVLDDATGSSEAVPSIDAPPAATHIEVTSRADGGRVSASRHRAALYRAEMLERLDPGIFETPDPVDLVDLAMARYGAVGLLRGRRHPAPRARRRRPTGPRHCGRRPARPAPGPPRPARTGRRPGTWPERRRGRTAAARRDRRPGRLLPDEGDGLPDRGVRLDDAPRVVAEVMTTVADLGRSSPSTRPCTRRRTGRSPPTTLAGSRSSTARRSCSSTTPRASWCDLERHALPFVLQLYPGGGLHLGEPAAERKLKTGPRLAAAQARDHHPAAGHRARAGGHRRIRAGHRDHRRTGRPRATCSPVPGLRTNYFGSRQGRSSTSASSRCGTPSTARTRGGRSSCGPAHARGRGPPRARARRRRLRSGRRRRGARGPAT